MANDIELHGWDDLHIPTQAMLDLTSREFKLYAYLIFRARNKGSAFPGVERIASDLTRDDDKWSESTVKRTLADLGKKSYIVRNRRLLRSSTTHVFKTPELCKAFLARQLTSDPSVSSPVTPQSGHERPDIKTTQLKENEGEGEEGQEPAGADSGDQAPSHIDSKHPAVQAYRAALLRFPAKTTYGEIASIVGEGADDVKLWGDLVRYYKLKRWNTFDLNNLLNHFREIKRGEKPPPPLAGTAAGDAASKNRPAYKPANGGASRVRGAQVSQQMPNTPEFDTAPLGPSIPLDEMLAFQREQSALKRAGKPFKTMDQWMKERENGTH